MMRYILDNLLPLSIGACFGAAFNLCITKFVVRWEFRKIKKWVKAIPTNRRNVEDTLENKDHNPEPDPLAEAAKAVAPIVLTAEQWTILEPHFKAWHEKDPRLEEIREQMSRLSAEAKMIQAAQEFYGGLLTDEIVKLFPETKGVPMHYKDDDGKRILERCPGFASTIEIDSSHIPPHLRNLLRGLGLGH